MNTTLWHNFRFTKFLAAITINNLGDWFDIFALQIIFAHEFNASPLIMGMLAFLYFIPGILFSPLAGAIADRYSKRNVMLITDILSAGLTIGLLLSQNILTALLLVFIRSAIYSLNAPTQQAYVKEVVPDENLLEASSYTTISFSLAKILGPTLGAVILIAYPARVCLGINSISFILSFFILLTLPFDKPLSIPEVKQISILNGLDSIKNGCELAWRIVYIRMAIILAFVWYLCSNAYNSQLALLLKHILPQKINVLGYMLGFEALGAIASAMLLSRWKAIQNYGLYFFFAFCFIAAGTYGISIYQASWPIVFLFLAPLIRGIGSGIGSVTYSYLFRKESPPSQIGRITGMGSAMQNLASAIGTLLSGVFVIAFGSREVYSGIAIAMFLLAISALFLSRNIIQKT